MLLEQNVFNITLLSFNDNKVLKMSIVYANIYSSVQDHKQKFSVFNSRIGSEEQMRALESTKRRLTTHVLSPLLK